MNNIIVILNNLKNFYKKKISGFEVLINCNVSL